VHKRVWEAYHAPSKRAFSQRLRRLKEWAEHALPDSAMKSHTLDLCDKRVHFIQSYDHRYAHRTSNMVDRLMKFLDRACFKWPIFPWNVRVRREPGPRVGVAVEFLSLVSRTVKKYHGQACPAERLNGQRYADNWLENLLISGSMNGVDMDQQNPL